MKRLSGLIRLDKEFSASVSALREQYAKSAPLPIAINGLGGDSAVTYAVEMALESLNITDAPTLIIASSDGERDKIHARLLENGIRACVYKPRELVFHNISASHDAERERLLVLSSILGAECEAVVTTVAAAALYTPPRSLLESVVVTLHAGDIISPDSLAEKLSTLGFARVELVEAAGQFARRGGIIDFCADSKSPPYRIEFFGDEIDRIVSFDIITQRAISSQKEVKLTPAHEVMMTPSAKERVKKEILRLKEKTKDDGVGQTLKKELSAVEAGTALDSRDKYLGLIYPERESLITYLTSVGKPAVIMMGGADVLLNLKSYSQSLREGVSGLLSAGLVSERSALYAMSAEELSAELGRCVPLYLNAFSSSTGVGELGGLFGFRTRRTVSFGNNISLLAEELKTYVGAGYKVIIQCENRQGVKSLIDTLLELKFSAVYEIFEDFDFGSAKLGSIGVTTGTYDGFDLISPRVALLSMAEDEGRRIMAQRRRTRLLKKVGGAGERIMSHADLTVGDYVVHREYGIGLFEGMESVRIDGVTKDYITIRYAGTDKLFVPCERLEVLGKYIGERNSDGTVKLSKMGGGDWHKTKSRAKAAAKNIAKQLIELYARRQRTEGFAFPSDSDMEREFALAFEYDLTESQEQAIEEISADMMKPVPMNRLLLGDVGFGKTEVALRAAFKAVMGGKQVAFLVPTTILALQHYQTALSRMRGYPINIEMLSRFKKPKEQEKILAAAKRGAVDILIGTHKLLSKKIEFRDLGLLIVDEEQRFGVSQKERLKELSYGVDVLTLSATPIPRTLNMAINGISDMSVLDEAPEDRQPVQTYVMEHDDAVVYDAIRKELHRGGQVLYLYNSIDTIDFMAGKIMKEIPAARVATAHGQMERDELEDIWQALVRAEIDVLVCTTIVETGIDLPNANTLIIENADKMGLSQLHQLRGRVGRSRRQAYAYFTYRSGKVLSEIAAKRLSAIREYAEFGAGFKVALRDLEIRGAGNLLGAEQHGYIDSVGYDLYVRLLNEAVLEERGEVAPEVFEATVDIKVDAHIPDYYIKSSAQRIDMYRKISLIETPDDKDDVYDELCDRFGQPPAPTERLLSVALCRAIAGRARIKRVELRGGTVLFHMEKANLALWSEVFVKHNGQLMGSGVGTAPIFYKLRAGQSAVGATENVLKDYYAAMVSDEKEKSESGGGEGK